jgi:anti-anti-sigma factor
MTQDRFRIVPLGVNGLRLLGELDLASAPALQEALRRLPAEVTLDLSELTFADSVGLQTILEHGAQAAMTLVGVRPIVMKIFEIAGVLDGRAGPVIEPIQDEAVSPEVKPA